MFKQQGDQRIRYRNVTKIRKPFHDPTTTLCKLDIYVYIYNIYTYIYIEREREKERETEIMTVSVRGENNSKLGKYR